MLPRFVVPALAAAAFHSATPASAGSLQSPPGNGTYMIKALHSGKCLDVVGASTQDGTPIQQFSCDPSKASQRFALSMQGGYKLRSGDVVQIFKLTTFSNKCVGLRTQHDGQIWTGLGNYIEQQTCVTAYVAYNQRFFWHSQQHPWEGTVIRAMPDGTSNAPYCLHIQSASSSDGTGPLLAICNSSGTGAKNDSFIFMPVGS